MEAGLRSAAAFLVRRCQIVLASEYGAGVPRGARQVGGSEQTVRNVVPAFNTQGVACLPRGTSRPPTTRERLGVAGAERLQALLHQSPRTFGHPTSLWTLELAAEASFAHGLTPQRVSRAAIRTALRRLDVSGQRARQWITSPAPAYARKKARDRLIRWAASQPEGMVGCEDEPWWSRLAQSALHAWTPTQPPLRGVEQTVPPPDPAPQALACCGLLVHEQTTQGEGVSQEQVGLRFVADRPVRAVTVAFLTWVCAKVTALGKTALLLVWDNASWHCSQAVRQGLREHNQQVKREGHGIRSVRCPLPSKSP